MRVKLTRRLSASIVVCTHLYIYIYISITDYDMAGSLCSSQEYAVRGTSIYGVTKHKSMCQQSIVYAHLSSNVPKQCDGTHCSITHCLRIFLYLSLSVHVIRYIYVCATPATKLLPELGICADVGAEDTALAGTPAVTD